MPLTSVVMSCWRTCRVVEINLIRYTQAMYLPLLCVQGNWPSTISKPESLTFFVHDPKSAKLDHVKLLVQLYFRLSLNLLNC